MLTPRIAVLLVALAIVLAPWLLWQVPAVRRIAPLAVLQILMGILLGPTGLGRVAPSLSHALFTPDVLGQLSGLALIGVLAYVLVAGLHLDAGRLRGQAVLLAAPTLGSIVLPLALGLGAGWWMEAHLPGIITPGTDPAAFPVAIAICVSVTALPVLAAVLVELGLIETALGQDALAIAAMNDAALWVMIALLLSLSRGTAAAAAVTVGAMLLWLAAMVFLIRPVLARLARRSPGAMLVSVIAVALASSATSESIGLGYITGAFAAGAIVPGAVRAPLLAVIEPLTAVLLLPFFFAVTGLRALIDPASSVFVAVLAISTLATIAGKVLGTALPARLMGTPWRDALALGSLMQTKGLMEVVVLAILADAGLIGPAVFSALVAMAVLCTLLAAPLARALLKPTSPACGAG